LRRHSKARRQPSAFGRVRTEIFSLSEDPLFVEPSALSWLFHLRPSDRTASLPVSEDSAFHLAIGMCAIYESTRDRHRIRGSRSLIEVGSPRSHGYSPPQLKGAPRGSHLGASTGQGATRLHGREKCLPKAFVRSPEQAHL
jgi:hypothetical protein